MPCPPINTNRNSKPPTYYRLSFPVGENNVVTLRDDFNKKLLSGWLLQEEENVYHLQVPSKRQALKARE